MCACPAALFQTRPWQSTFRARKEQLAFQEQSQVEGKRTTPGIKPPPVRNCL